MAQGRRREGGMSVVSQVRGEMRERGARKRARSQDSGNAERFGKNEKRHQGRER